MAGSNIAKFADLDLGENYLKCVIKTIAHADEPQATSYPPITRQSALGWLYHHQPPTVTSPDVGDYTKIGKLTDTARYSLLVAPKNKIDGIGEFDI